MSTSNFSSDNYVAKEASSLIQKISLLSSSENKQQSQSQSQSQSQQQQSKLWIENNEDEKEVQNVDEDENDSDYEVNKEEEEEENEQEENDDKLLDEICVNDENEDENEQDLDNEEDLTDVKKELNEALDVVKNIALRHKEIIVSKIIDYQSSNGEEITSQNVQDAFKLLQKQLNQDDEEEEDDQDDQDNEDELQEEEEEEVDMLSSDNDVDEDELQEEEEEDELDVELEDELEENEIELNEEYDENDVEDLSAEAQQVLSEDIEEAMQIASELGKQARQELSSKYYESFIEITGEEPNKEQINAIFQRMQEELSNEAEEELFDNYEESYEDDCIDVTSILLNKISSLDNEEKKEFFEESQSLIPQETQNELKQQYIDSWGKEPNDEEFQNILITLAQTKFIDQYFADNINDNDSDYDPEQDSQQDEQENDEDEYSSDEDDELENLKKDIGDEILQQCWQAFETKFGRQPNFDEQISNVELLLNSQQFQQFCQNSAIENNSSPNNSVEQSDQF